jgi:hypothetical protein
MKREERLAENEILFRGVSERIRELAGGKPQMQIAFMCECADDACTEVMTMKVAEYERLRSVPTYFGVRPGHETEEIERVVERHAGYHVVEK